MAAGAGAGVEEITAGIKRASISLQVTPKNQFPASSASKHIPCGFGYLPLCTRFDPSLGIRAEDDSLTYILVPTTRDIQDATPLSISGEKPAYHSCGETEAYGVTNRTSGQLERFGFTPNGQVKFSSRGLDIGIALGNSYNGHDIRYSNVCSADLESKGSESSLLPAFAQAAVSSSNFLMALLNRGIPINKCVVGVVANTGINMCFGGSFFLNNSFPVVVPLSKQLDLLDHWESKIASAYLQKLSDHGRRLSALALRSQPPKPLVAEMCLLVDDYFVKKLSAEALNRGLAHFSSRGDLHDVQDGLNHMICCLNRLYTSEFARDVPEYPLAIRTPESMEFADGKEMCYELIYRDLSKLGYSTGTPDRTTSPDLYNAFVSDLKRVLLLVHQAGVIHVDLYASNIMWKVVEHRICIKIVDWDIAHCLHEGRFAPKIEAALKDRIYDRGEVTFGIEHDNRYLAVYDQPMMEAFAEQWRALASGVKCEADRGFYELMLGMQQGL